jgi:hypothetical protein
LNKEFNKLKSENKINIETVKKYEKERSEVNSKLKNKTESLEKIKKENEELMILIQTSNYKSFASIESENKRLKSEGNLNLKEIENLKEKISDKDRKIKDLEIDYEKIRINFENFIKFKKERENLILDNTKKESELKRLKYEFEENKNEIEKLNIILKNKEEIIIKLSDEFNYLNFNAKKLKTEADRNLQDAVAYQKILRKMEKELADCQLKKEKIENENKIMKANLMG